MSIKYLFIDMNSYFASVEQQLNPHLRGKPVAVVPVDADTTSCIAASYEAKRFGVKTGTRVSDAKAMCPGIHIIPAQPKIYIEKHHQIVDAVESILPVTKVMSVDEMICQLRGDHTSVDRATDLALAIKKAIQQRAGTWMKCSIGISSNRLLAKVAADMKKPDGLTLIRQQDLPGPLLQLELKDFPGIGQRMERRLFLAGVTTVERFLQLSEKEISRIWGSRLLGGMWYHRLRGYDVPDSPTQRQSIGHSRVLEPTFRNERDSKAVLIRLIHKAAARLRHIGYFAGSVQLSVSYLNHPKWRVGHRINACQDTLTLLKIFQPLWEDHPDGIPKKVGIVLGDLTKACNVTRSLFEEKTDLEQLSHAMDEANEKFGRYAVYFGGMHGKGDAVSTRIAFGTVPDTNLADC